MGPIKMAEHVCNCLFCANKITSKNSSSTNPTKQQPFVDKSQNTTQIPKT